MTTRGFLLTVIGSMEYELAGVRKGLRAVGSRVRSGQFLYKGKAVELLVTGVGRECTNELERYLRAREEHPRGGQLRAPSGLLHLGFAGAVDPALHVGDLVLSSRYCRTESQAESQAQPLISPALTKPDEPAFVNKAYLTPDPIMWRQAVAAAEGMGQQVAYADSLTTDRLVTTREMKQKIRDKYPVGVVNMEDYWAGMVARAARVPYLSVRVVLDPAHQALPSYLPSLAGSPVWAALKTAAMPWRIPTLVGLARQLPAAQGVLARFAINFLDQMISDEPDQQRPRQPGSRLPSSVDSRVPA